MHLALGPIVKLMNRIITSLDNPANFGQHRFEKSLSFENKTSDLTNSFYRRKWFWLCFILDKLNERIRWRNFIEKKQRLNSTARELLAVNYSFGFFL